MDERQLQTPCHSVDPVLSEERNSDRAGTEDADRLGW